MRPDTAILSRDLDITREELGRAQLEVREAHRRIQRLEMMIEIWRKQSYKAKAEPLAKWWQQIGEWKKRDCLRSHQSFGRW